MEHAKSAANRRLVVFEGIKREPDSRIEVLPGWIGLHHVRNIRERPVCQEIDDGEQIPLSLDWVAHRLITQTEVHRQPGADLPVILRVDGEIDLTIIADLIIIGRVQDAGQRGCRSVQEVGEGSKNSTRIALETANKHLTALVPPTRQTASYVLRGS